MTQEDGKSHTRTFRLSGTNPQTGLHLQASDIVSDYKVCNMKFGATSL